MQITPAVLKATYIYLKHFEPFTGLPSAADIAFKVTKCKEDRGYYHYGGGSKEFLIAVSASLTTHLDSLMKVMAHEMLHLLQEIDGTETETMHNKDFQALGYSLCQEMGWDPGLF